MRNLPVHLGTRRWKVMRPRIALVKRSEENMADLLDQLRTDIDQRLRELRPALEETEQLERALEALNSSDERTSAAKNDAKPQGKRKRITEAEAEARKRQALAIVAKDPKTRPSALATLLGMSASNTYNLLRRLEKDGALKKTDGGYQVQDGAGVPER
jgi:predicted Rossmann fold nucleotide-binding protein DprA/Smf involved in DNA uptake